MVSPTQIFSALSIFTEIVASCSASSSSGFFLGGWGMGRGFKNLKIWRERGRWVFKSVLWFLGFRREHWWSDTESEQNTDWQSAEEQVSQPWHHWHLGLDTLIFRVEGCVVYCRMFHGISGLYAFNASSTPAPLQLWRQKKKCLQTLPRVSWLETQFLGMHFRTLVGALVNLPPSPSHGQSLPIQT